MNRLSAYFSKPSKLTPLERAHAIGKQVEDAIRRNVPEADISVHCHPVTVKNETLMERVKTIVFNHNLVAHNIYLYRSGGYIFINFDVEFPPKEPVEKTHEAITHIENTLIAELGQKTNINIHVEPAQIASGGSKKVKTRTKMNAYEVINRLKSEIKEIEDIHNVSVHEINKKLPAVDRIFVHIEPRNHAH